jgi:hypothetical protein
VKRPLLLIASFALVVTACGGDSETTEELPIDSGSGDDRPIASACLEGEPDCNDTPGGEPTDLPTPGDVTDEPLPAAIQPGDAADVSGPVAVAGFIVAVGNEIKICEALAESFPPQCGGAFVTVTDLGQVDPDSLQTAGNVMWTDYSVTISGEMVDGTLVATPVE